MTKLPALTPDQSHQLWMHLADRYDEARDKRAALTALDAATHAKWMHLSGQMAAYATIRGSIYP